jgi:hypothetical protein
MFLRSDTFNGSDGTTIGLHRKQGTTFRSSAIDQDIAGTAAAGIATYMGTG